MSCRLDAPISADEKKQRLQHLYRKERLSTDLLIGLLSDSNPLAYGPLAHEPTPFDNFWNGLLDALQVDDDRLYEEIDALKRWLDEYSGV